MRLSIGRVTSRQQNSAMRVLLNIYQTAFQNPGGGEIVIAKHHEYLRRLGVEVEYFNQWSTKISDYDVVHNFGYQNPDFWSAVKDTPAKLVVSPIIWPEVSFRRRIGNFLMSLNDGFSKYPNNPFRPYFNYRLPDVLLPNSPSEANRLIDAYAVPAEKIRVIPNGVDERFADANPRPFTDAYRLENFILCVGRIAPVKNQLNLLKAHAGMEIPLVIIGSPNTDALDYYQECRAAAAKNVTFIDRLPHGSDLLASAYAAARLLVLPSVFETCGLVALEAGLAGTRVLVTQNGGTRDYFRKYAGFLDPHSIDQIRASLFNSLALPHDPEPFRRHILKHYLWEKIIEQTYDLYQEVMAPHIEFLSNLHSIFDSEGPRAS